MASTEPVIDNPTEPSIKPLTGVPAETYTANLTASLTEPAKDFVTKTPTEPSCESCTSPATESGVEPVTMPISETASEPTVESLTHTTHDSTFGTSNEPVTEAAPASTTEAATESCTAPAPESCDEPVNMATTGTSSEPTAEPLTQSVSVLTPEAYIKLSNEGSSESSSDSSTGTGDDSSTETANKSGTKKFVAVEGKDALEHLARIEEIPAVDMLTPRSTVSCSACTFSPERQRCCNYESQVKIFYEAGDRGVWALGSDLILKDRGPSCPTDENANIRFVKKNTTIPVPTVIAHHQESDGHALTIMSRVPGENLSEAWSKLTDDQKENIAKQTAEYLLQLRSLQSDRVEGVDGRPVYDGWLYKEKDRHNAPCPPMMSDDEVWNGLAVHLDPAVPESARRQLRRYMPPTQPFTFTHNDLTHVNIMVKDSEVMAIIDWERAGFFPVWWEYVCTMATHAGKEDFEWNKLLRKYMPEMDDAHDFFLYYYHLCNGLESDAAKQFIAMSEEYDSEKDESEEDESKEIES